MNDSSFLLLLIFAALVAVVFKLDTLIKHTGRSAEIHEEMNSSLQDIYERLDAIKSRLPKE